MKYAQTWLLDSLFPGGSTSPQFVDFLKDISAQIHSVQELLKEPTNLQKAILAWQDIHERLSQTSSFVGCLIAQNVQDTQAEQWQGHLSDLGAALANVSEVIDEQLKQMSDAEFQTLTQQNDFQAIAYPLSYRRQRAKGKLGLAQERLINDLSVDGYHGWSQIYGTLIGQVVIPVNGRDLSWGQTYNLLSHSDRSVRKAAFESSNVVWKQQKQFFSSILNHIAGFRLKFYERRGWPVLKEPLDINRMSAQTLETMWRVIEKNKQPFVDYMERKARHLGLKQLHWYDLEAPFSTDSESKTSSISYDEAADFIITHFSEFSPKMGDYARMAFEKRWIEAEDRGHKRPGGFCTDVPLQKESRIFMTYSGTKESMVTLAHELGHAYHNHVIFDLPELARHFPMNLAETASTFAEMVVSEATLKIEKDPAKRLALLDGRLQRSVAYLFNIHARYLFDLAFHEQRKRGTLSAEQLCTLMEECQKQAYCGTLEEYHPYFWASKMHFSSTGVPFYNFPYTFGYLFSLGVYLRAMEESPFEERYNALLADTGRMSAEDLAQKHLGVDLRQEGFWQHTIDYLKQDAKEFCK